VTSTRAVAWLVSWAVLGCGSPPQKPAGECGRLDAPRTPALQTGAGPVNPSVHALRQADGGLRILVNPILHDGTPIPELRASDLTLRVEGDFITDFTLARISPSSRAEADLLFAIDTASSMRWAASGVRASVASLVESLRLQGFDAAAGGIEFSDELRTRTPIGSLVALDAWLSTITPLGGGDLPSSALDAAYEAGASFEYRRSAARYLVLITRGGMHERDDGTECARKSFQEAVTRVRGTIFTTVCYVDDRAARIGIAPGLFAERVGGMQVAIDPNRLDQFDLVQDTDLDSIVGESYGISVPAAALPDPYFSGSLEFTVDGAPVFVSFLVAP
jgi:hypothetical protein